jgi:CxxC motif-containing protein (DUF1111 family)
VIHLSSVVCLHSARLSRAIFISLLSIGATALGSVAQADSAISTSTLTLEKNRVDMSKSAETAKASNNLVTIEQWQHLIADTGQRDDLDKKTLARVEAITRPTENFSKPEKFEKLPAGKATSKKRVDHNAFSHFSANLSFAQQQDFALGNAIFRKSWVSSPASTLASDGLGPLFNARSCQGCHLKDGRGHPPKNSDDDTTSFLLKLAIPATTKAQQRAIAVGEKQNIVEPRYGGQFQDKAVMGILPEGKVDIRYQTLSVTLADGEEVHLQKPVYSLSALQYGDMSSGVMLSPRIAPPMIGLGLIEQIHSADLVRHADPDDIDNDGISGKLSVVVDPELEYSLAKQPAFTIGRFGWKASQATIKQQTAGAFSNDMGLSTESVPQHFGECTVYQKACREAPNGVQAKLGNVEVPENLLDLTTFYSQNLAVPQRRDIANKQVLRGKKIFYQSGCADCHIPKYVTRKDAENPALAFQLIWPYSDFLLHDMGEGLADGFSAGSANGQEWRTTPLWGIGLTEVVNDHSRFLHDGRARNLLEAVLWHGGEAATSQQKVVALDKTGRQDLLAFLQSL